MFPGMDTREGVDFDSVDHGLACFSSRLHKYAMPCKESSLSWEVMLQSGKKRVNCRVFLPV